MARKFHRPRGRRRLFVKNLVANLVAREHIETTVPRAKEIRPRVERLITYGKRGGVSAFRQILRQLPKEEAEKLFYEIAPRYKDRAGGYVRIIKKATTRKRDGTPLARIEFV